ncbi:hypothetical protein J2805_002175 [Arthrobacter oryzae]|nr:hypothetical protein [Arthrobacter oryzae]
MPHLQGEEHPRHKLTAEQVREIRGRYSPGITTQAELATEYRTSRQLISQILNRQVWTHLTN